MDKITGAIVVVLVAIICCFGVAMVTSPQDEEPDQPVQSFGIEYDLGGISADNGLNPATYEAGKTIDFKPAFPLLEGDEVLYFGGWYLDPDFTKLFMGTAADTTGDLKLYAKWQDDRTGQSYTLSFDGTVRDGLLNTYRLYGTQTTTYRYYSEDMGGYYTSYDVESTQDYGITSYTSSNSWSQWPDDDDTQVDVVGTETIDTIYGPKECYILSVVGTGVDNKQWIGTNDFLPYKIEDVSKALFKSSAVTYTLSSSTNVEVVNEVEVRGYADEGITVTGGGTIHPTETTVLTATAQPGYEFQGWMYDGQIYTDPTIQVTAEWQDMDIFALNTVEWDYEAETGTEQEIPLNTGRSDPSWSIHVYGSAGEVLSGHGDTMVFDLSEAGPYEIYIEDESSGYYGYRSMFVGGDIVRTYEWQFKGKDYSTKLVMDYKDVQKYRDMMAPEDRQQKISYDNADRHHERQFVTYDDPYIQYLAGEFVKMTPGFSQLDRANFVLAFLQSIEYQSDDVFMGYTEYFKYPVETLYDKGGDCEDSSILYCAIVKAMGYETALMIFPGHAMASVHVDNLRGGQYIDYQNVRYYYVESTSDNALVGYKAPNIGNPNAVIPI